MVELFKDEEDFNREYSKAQNSINLTAFIRFFIKI